MSKTKQGFENLVAWAKEAIPDIVSEFKFHSKRKWKFDYASPKNKIAFEYEGGIWQHGRNGKSRHCTPSGYSGDCEKYSYAALMGWVVIRTTGEMIRNGVASTLFSMACRYAEENNDMPHDGQDQQSI